MNRYLRELADRKLAMRLALAGRVHQYPEIQALKRFLSAFSVDCLFDVGANRGQYATMLRKDAGYKGLILSFEPNPDVFVELQKAAASDRKWHVFNMALSDFDGTASFNIMAADQFSSLKKPSGEQDAIFADRNKVTKTVEMQCRRLDTLLPELVAQHGFVRPFLKMDTQGHDLSVCEGAGAVLTDMLGIQTELGVRPIYEGGTGYRAMIDWLGDRGFVPSAFFANNKGHFPLLVEMDGIFVNRTVVGA
ncbi:FkbM family methyltransferase [Sphingobium limneticum]|jgi:FkbM family methyltransferase|uniref:FkbM family methyltransferase n=1 Tax=Sphingobium limneticum TaxID=1007511 RepID=A0A5J5I1C2_9SPHN|nr:FkbM family methyltransferase [Sphingobium limneticum]KAA9014245.1 FkbM family methyltransferase [Sphingobium limneticum]KAA9027334.1 FkbM family methyltransferase [Sphingobium limneticum]